MPAAPAQQSGAVFFFAAVTAGTIGTALSHIADNILLIGYHVDGSDVRRAIHVLKSRGSAHDQGIFEFTVAADGVHIGDPIKIDIGLPRRAEAEPGAR